MRRRCRNCYLYYSSTPLFPETGLTFLLLFFWFFALEWTTCTIVLFFPFLCSVWAFSSLPLGCTMIPILFTYVPANILSWNLSSSETLWRGSPADCQSLLPFAPMRPKPVTFLEFSGISLVAEGLKVNRHDCFLFLSRPLSTLSLAVFLSFLCAVPLRRKRVGGGLYFFDRSYRGPGFF